MNLRIIETVKEFKLSNISQYELICELEALKIKIKQLEYAKNKWKNFLKM